MKRIIESFEEGIRLDAFMAKELPELTRSAAQRLIDNGQITLGGVPMRKNHRVKCGEIFEITFEESAEMSEKILPQEIPLRIVYEDADVIVVDKPRGLVVHPAPGHPDNTLVNALMYHCGDSLSGIGGEKRPGIVHRLDKDTSGLIIAAKNDMAHISLAGQLADRSLTREYEAVVCGRLKNGVGSIDAPIGRHVTDRKRQAVTDKNSRNAVTHYRAIAEYNGYTHVRCKLQTGRTHQIRVHMAYIGHPVLGDLIYGRKKPEKGLSGQCLHAKQLTFIHPRTGKSVFLDSDLPDYFVMVLSKLGAQI